MKKYGLLGKNIDYSFSPILHKEIFKKINQENEYDLFDLEEDEIENLIEKIRQNKIEGINVTIPYKEKVLDYIDEVSENVREIGAVNTIYKFKNKVIGENTDFFGFLKTIKKLNVDIKNKNVGIIGSGGSAKSVLQVIKKLDGIPYIISRNPVEKKKIFKDIRIINYDELKNLKGELLINCTPLGNKNHSNISPISKEISLNWRYGIDLNYIPEVSLFLSYFKEKNRLNGLYMLVVQGIKSEIFWQKQEISIDEIYNKIYSSVYR